MTPKELCEDMDLAEHFEFGCKHCQFCDHVWSDFGLDEPIECLKCGDPKPAPPQESRSATKGEPQT